MARRRGRGLHSSERALWQKVTAGVAPMADTPEQRPTSAPAQAGRDIEPPKTPVRRAETAIPPDFHIGQRVGFRDPAATHVATRPPLPEFDRRTKAAIAKGRTGIDSRIDLHGMTLAQAHVALIGFLRAAQARGDRLVLVITGKGRGGDGALRRQVPHWIAAAPVAGMVVASGTAAPAHGGEGALYVRLRRRR